MNLSHLTPLVRDRALRRQLAIYVLARLPSGMLVLALLLLANARLPKLSGVGAVVAVYSVTVAVVAPIAGRLADRKGARRVLPITALVYLAGITVIICSYSIGWLCLGAVIAGAGLPPTPACLRGQWRTLAAPTRTSVFTVDGIILEAAQVVGPLLVAVLTALFSAAVAVATSAACTATAAVLTAAVLPATTRSAAKPRHWTGPLRFPAVDLLLSVIALTTGAIAIIEVSVVSYASDRGSSALAGVLFAGMAGGSTLGGVLFAARGSSRRARDVLPVLCLLSAAGFALLPAAGANTWLLFALLAISNLPISPAFACVFTSLSDVAPEDESAETFTWAASANFLAISGGTALGGVLLTHADRWVAYVVSVVVLLAATGTAIGARILDDHRGETRGNPSVQPAQQA